MHLPLFLVLLAGYAAFQPQAHTLYLVLWLERVSKVVGH